MRVDDDDDVDLLQYWMQNTIHSKPCIVVVNEHGFMDIRAVNFSYVGVLFVVGHFMLR